MAADIDMTEICNKCYRPKHGYGEMNGLTLVVCPEQRPDYFQYPAQCECSCCKCGICEHCGKEIFGFSGGRPIHAVCLTKQIDEQMDRLRRENPENFNELALRLVETPANTWLWPEVIQ